VLLVVGIGFKVSLFPFHAWTPDVYQGAPTSVSGFMATGVKVVMFTLFLRIAMTHVFVSTPKIISVLQVIAVLTMTVGNVTAIVQENIKRMIAYSSIAHAGYILVGIIAACTSKTPEAASAVLFYLAGYSAMNIGAFAIVNIFEKEERGNLSVMDYSGLGYKYPLLGVGLAIFMFSLAGIPPTVGFMGKFYIFASAIKEGYLGLAIMGVINSLLSAYYYLRVLVALYMADEVFSVRPSGGGSARFVVMVTILLTLLMGILSAAFYAPALSSVVSLLAKQ
jgi:NADH-quinone oxidoreductase subunit N